MSPTRPTLRAVTVGVWRPRIQAGATLTPGQLVGHLVRLGRRIEVRVPALMEGTARTIAPEGAWVEYGATLVSARAESLAALPAPRVEAEAPSDVVVIRAVTDGTIWLQPEPGAEPFIVEGRFVGAGDVLALVEVMKTFTPVRSSGPGVIARLLVEDGQSVERGQALLWVRVASRRSARAG